MRFLIGEFAHESNCFSAELTDRRRFEEGNLYEGDALLAEHDGKGTVLGGFIEAARRDGHTLIPSIAASTFPSGPVDGAFYLWARDAMAAAARAAAPLDGVLLSLHGGMYVAPGPRVPAAAVADPEGDIVAAIDLALGGQTPIAVVLDLHSDSTEALLGRTAFTLAYNEEPHRDAYDRGLEAAALMERLCRGEIRPTAARRRALMLLPSINMATDRGPMHDLHELRATLEARPGVLDLSIHAGFYGSDQPEAGFSVVCTTDADPDLAQRLADHVALEAWRRRRDFLVAVTPPDEAVRVARDAGGPVGLIDEADDPAGGTPCDSVEILRSMIDGGISRGGVSTIKDAEAVRAMADAGEGVTLRLSLGAKTDDRHGAPISLCGRVARIDRRPAPVNNWSGRAADVGALGVLDANGILVVVTEHKLVTENVDIFAHLGFDVRAMQAVCFKGLTLHIRQALGDKMRHYIPVDGVGITHPDVRKLGRFEALRRPAWPLDDVSDDAMAAILRGDGR